MFTKILWATDGSQYADHALDLAKSLAQQDSASLVAFHSIEHITGPGARGAFTEDADEDERRTKIKGQVKDLTDQGMNVDLKVVHGGMTGAAHTIAEIAKEDGVDLIVIGTRGHTPLAGLLLGGVTQRLLHIAPCPVLVVPAEGS